MSILKNSKSFLVEILHNSPKGFHAFNRDSEGPLVLGIKMLAHTEFFSIAEIVSCNFLRKLFGKCKEMAVPFKLPAHVISNTEKHFIFLKSELTLH